MYKFELPLNERTRRLMSIENIFLRLKDQINSCRADFSEIGCFELYFIMRGTASRADIKIEITQELEKLILKKKQLPKTKKNIDQIKKLMDGPRTDLLNFIDEYVCSVMKRSNNTDLLGAYSSFEGSPSSEGILQFDMWEHDTSTLMHNWINLRNEIN